MYVGAHSLQLGESICSTKAPEMWSPHSWLVSLCLLTVSPGRRRLLGTERLLGLCPREIRVPLYGSWKYPKVRPVSELIKRKYGCVALSVLTQAGNPYQTNTSPGGEATVDIPALTFKR